MLLKEDCPYIDIGGFVVGDKEEISFLYMKSSGIIAGIPFASLVYDILQCVIEWKVDEGSFIEVKENEKHIVAVVKGKCNSILLGERVSLNILSRASGVATGANEVCQISKRMNWNGLVAGTRKTTPGFGKIEKYALIVGGCATHR